MAEKKKETKAARERRLADKNQPTAADIKLIKEADVLRDRLMKGTGLRWTLEEDIPTKSKRKARNARKKAAKKK
jgi:hypothetical protein